MIPYKREEKARAAQIAQHLSYGSRRVKISELRSRFNYRGDRIA
jgi:hypothetical protein